MWLIEHAEGALSDSDCEPGILDSDADSLTDEFNDDPPLLEVWLEVSFYSQLVTVFVLD